MVSSENDAPSTRRRSSRTSSSVKRKAGDAGDADGEPARSRARSTAAGKGKASARGKGKGKVGDEEGDEEGDEDEDEDEDEDSSDVVQINPNRRRGAPVANESVASAANTSAQLNVSLASQAETEARMRVLEAQRSAAVEAREASEERAGKLVARLDELKDAMDGVHAQLEAEREKSAATLAEEQRKHAAAVEALEERLADAEERADASRVDLEDATDEQLETFRARVAELEKEAEESTRRRSEDQQYVAEMEGELEKATARVAELEAAAGDAAAAADTDALIRSLRDQLATAGADGDKQKAELVKLREQVAEQENAAVLVEELNGVRAKLARAEEAHEQTRIELAETESKLAERSEWQAHFDGERSDPADVAAELKQLQEEALAASVREGDLLVAASESRTAAEARQAEVVRVTAAHETSAARVLELEDKLASSERQVLVLTKERDGLQSTLQTFQSSENDAVSEQVKALETALEEARAQIRTLEAGAHAATPDRARDAARIRKLEATVEEAKSANAALSKQSSELVREIAKLENRLGKGEYNRKTTKVLHMIMNPEQKAMKRSVPGSLGSADGVVAEQAALLEEQRTEIMELKKRLASNDVAELGLLRRKMEDAERLTLRLKDVFKKKIQDFRSAVYDMLGYKIDMLESQYRLQSKYANNDDECLLFQVDGDGHLALLETDFCAQLDDNVMAYLRTCDSIPAFLSTVTLELFNNKTFVR